METLHTEFLTYHHSAKDLHVRTTSHVLFIDSSKAELIELAKQLPRGQPIVVTGEMKMSKILSTQVLEVETLKPRPA